MLNYAKYVSTRQTPQSEAVLGKNQVQNTAGGFVFALDKWGRLDRFLILGCDGGTYYASEKTLTKENAKCILDCLQEDGARTVAKIVEISESGRAPKNDAAIFALALAMSYGDVPTKQAAAASLSRVARIGTFFFQFVDSISELRGLGKIVHRALQNWYLQMEPRALAYQVCKYQQREKWSHRDVLRLCRPKAEGDHQEIFKWIVKGWDTMSGVPPSDALLPIWATEHAKRASSARQVAHLIRDFRLVRECIPTQWLKEPEVWEALLEEMPLGAMIRNLATMTRIGLITPMSNALRKVLADMSNVERLRKARIHPVNVLSALKTYAQGHGEQGQNSWNPLSQVVDGLDGLFYNSFQNVEPSGKRMYLACDVSGSMWPGWFNRYLAQDKDLRKRFKLSGLCPGLLAGAMALVTARVEPNWYMAAFHDDMVPFAPSPRQRLDDFCTMMEKLPWGRTNCALPMLHAAREKIPVDCFGIYTDNETWYGDIHPFQALRDYRQKMGINAKLVVIGMTATGFSIADPSDTGMLDVVGCDSATPALIADFARS